MATYTAPATFDDFVAQYDHFITVSIYRVSRGAARSSELEDLKQAVYARIIERNYLSRYDPSKGSFSTYIFWLIRSVVVNQFDKNTRNPLNMAVGTQERCEVGPRRVDAKRLVLEAHADFKDAAFERRQQAQEILTKLETCVKARTKGGPELAATLRLLYEGFEPGEIALRLGCSSTVVSEYRQALRGLLEYVSR